MDDPSSSIGALISLLADESKSTQIAATKALISLGAQASSALEVAANGEDPRVRARARRVLASMARESGEAALRSLLAPVDQEPAEGRGVKGEGVLIDGLLAIDNILGFREPHPQGPHPAGLHPSGSRRCVADAAIADWAAELRDADAWKEGPTLAASGALRRILADKAGLAGPDRDFHNLQHVSLSRTIVNGTGLPLTLSAIYATVARQNGLEAWLLPFPGQVLLALGPDSDRVLMDPFHRGALVSLSTCRARLAAMGAPDSPHWLSPASDRDMLVRQTRNLGAAMERHGRDRDARLFARLVDSAT